MLAASAPVRRDALRVPPPSYEPRSIGLSLVQPAASDLPQWEQAELLRELIVDSIVLGLRVGSGDEWCAYWDRDPPWELFNDLFHGLFAVVAQSTSQDRIAANAAECHDHIAAAFPDFDEHLDFVKSTMSRAVRIAFQNNRVPILDEQRRATDAECAQIFNWNARWHRIALNSLLVMSTLQEWGGRPIVVSPDVVTAILAVVRESALDTHHAALQGAHLREEERPAPSAPTDPDSVGDDDLGDVETALTKFETA